MSPGDFCATDRPPLRLRYMQQHTLAMVVLAGVAIGCTPDGGGKPPPPAAQDLGQPNIEPPPPPADLATRPDMAPIVCNDVDANGAPVVTAKYVAATAPAATGGAIADGTYALTAIGYYTGPGGMTGDAPQAFATVYRFKGNKLDVLMTTSPVGPFSASATFSTNGPQL